MAKKQTKAPEKAKTPIITQLVVSAPNRRSSDVGLWRNALRSADVGRVRVLYDLFEDLYLDGILYDAVDKRISAVTNAELTFQDVHGEQVDEIAELIDTSGFEELITTIMKTRFWGRAGMEFDFSDGFCVHEIPCKHIDLDRRVILRNETDLDGGIPYEKDDHLLILGKPRNFGLFIRTAPLVIYKRGAYGDYSQWLELFGMPQRIGKYSAHDPESRRILENALKNGGAAPYLVIPKETDVETIQTGGGGSGSAYNDFRIACNEEVLITVLGQTLTTIQGEKGARSLGEVHKQVEEGKNKADMRFVQHILNTRVLPLLEARGFPVAGGKFIFPKEAEPLSVSDVVQLSGIIDIPVKFLHDKYSIPMPKKGDKIAGHREDIEDAEIVDDDDKGSTSADPTPPADNGHGKKTKKSLRDFDLFKQFRDFFVQAPAKGAVQNFATNLIDNITGKLTLADGDVTVSININELFNKALKALYGDAVQHPAVEKHLFEITNRPLQEGISKVFSAPGLAFGQKNQAFIDEFKYNASVFAAFKNHQQTKEIINLLHDSDGNLRSFSKFKKLAQEVSQDYNKNWLRTEYNTAIRAARSAVNWKQMHMSKHLYPNLEYIQSRSREKRALHLDWVGTILPMDDLWWNTHMPPSDWNCQCSVKQTDKPTTGILSGGTGNPIFANNPGKTASFVNLKEHPYIKGVCPYVNDCNRKKISLADHPYTSACEICLFAKDSQLLINRVEESKQEYERLLADENYFDVRFGQSNGAIHAIHKNHNFDKVIGNYGIPRGDYERNAANVLFTYGLKVILASELAAEGILTPDGWLENLLFDIKGVEGIGKSAIKNKLLAANGANCEAIVFYFHTDKYFSNERMASGYSDYLGTKQGKQDNIKRIYYIIGNKLFRYK
jgi:hypothetical protein